MKTKITISKDGDRVYAKVPYKKGYVVWVLESVYDIWNGECGLTDSYTHVWSLYSKKREHNPDRVAKWHSEYLYGQKLMYSIRRTASAKHHYNLLEDLQSMEIFPYPLTKSS